MKKPNKYYGGEGGRGTRINTQHFPWWCDPTKMPCNYHTTIAPKPCKKIARKGRVVKRSSCIFLCLPASINHLNYYPYKPLLCTVLQNASSKGTPVSTNKYPTTHKSTARTNSPLKHHNGYTGPTCHPHHHQHAKIETRT